jgi:hypothetical protein
VPIRLSRAVDHTGVIGVVERTTIDTENTFDTENTRGGGKAMFRPDARL